MLRRMLRRAVPAALLLALAACGPQGAREAFTDSRVPPSVAPRFYPPEGWAWGLVKVGSAPEQRYGVSGPPVAPKANVLILTGYDDPAETWFETAADLNRRGYTVWLLERAGQGGSARLTGHRDLGHATSFDPDVAAVRAMVRVVIRPTGETPLILVGQSLGGLIALRAVQSGLGVDGLVLSAPLLTPPPTLGPIDSRWTRRLGLGGLRAPGQGGWRRDTPAERLTHDAIRGAMRHAWAEANPDLRMGGPSFGWLAAFRDTSDAAQAAVAQTSTPILLLTAAEDDNAASKRACIALPACDETAIPDAWRDLPREVDPARDAWLDALDDFIRRRTAAASGR